MRKITSVSQMQRLALGWRRGGLQVGLVPTMGYLHAGHLSLVKRARRIVGPDGLLVVSIYVNPTQFGPGEDLSKYPRDLSRDLRQCKEAGVDVTFAPDDTAMYSTSGGARCSTCVEESVLSRRMEGESRPTHFRGVTTVVAKLFNLVLPNVAVFGAKDWQQTMVVQRMVRDLNFPVRLVVMPTYREPDGLAMSSRNQYLTPGERAQATVLWQVIREARKAVRSAPLPADQLRRRLIRRVESRSLARLDYLEFFESETLEPVRLVCRGTHLALAVFFGKTRLIDNARL